MAGVIIGLARSAASPAVLGSFGVTMGVAHAHHAIKVIKEAYADCTCADPLQLAYHSISLSDTEVIAVVVYGLSLLVAAVAVFALSWRGLTTLWNGLNRRFASVKAEQPPAAPPAPDAPAPDEKSPIDAPSS